jgi:hypothetical protein
MTFYSMIQTFDACKNEAGFWKFITKKPKINISYKNLLRKTDTAWVSTTQTKTITLAWASTTQTNRMNLAWVSTPRGKILASAWASTPLQGKKKTLVWAFTHLLEMDQILRIMTLKLLISD